MKKEAIIRRTEKKHIKYGRFSKITFSDKSMIYVTKKGFTLVLADNKFKKNMKKAKKWGRIEMTIPYSEMNIALREAVILGYTESEDKTK